ncbi:hypothetical protein CASFOL_019313 [Castilleja foliolosa]|uniref:Uncharacterized protein n=1 Tax=Castilleja foliolosa TaxID=1961234 RepID=A0ABD3D722_9LAMI
MALATYYTTRKSYYYNFFPKKEDEEMPPAANSTVLAPRLNRRLVEIRDVHPPPQLNPHDPWPIKKRLNHYEIATGKIILSFQDTFEHIFRYWHFPMCKYVTMLCRRIAVVVWDMTNEKFPRKYGRDDVLFQMTPSEHSLLTCPEMMHDRKLKADDNIGLYWDPMEGVFRVKLLSSSGR